MTAGGTRVRSASPRSRLLVALAAVGLVGVFVWYAEIDWGTIRTLLFAADPVLLGLALVAGMLAQLAWARVTALVLQTVAPDSPTGRIHLGYLTGTFVKQVLPFGHAGGVPLLAYVLSEDLDLQYRLTFAAVAASELIIFVSSLLVATGGFVGFVLVTAPRSTAAIVGVTALVAVVSVASVAVLLWRLMVLHRVALGTAAVGRRTLGRVIPRVARALSPAAVTRSVDDFHRSFSHATADRTVLIRAGLYAIVGWLLFAMPLYLGLLAVGRSTSPALSLFLVPAGGIATLLPTPGGLGGTEVGTAAAVVFLTGGELETVAAGVLLYRLATYWLVVAVGAIASLYLSVDVREVAGVGTGET